MKKKKTLTHREKKKISMFFKSVKEQEDIKKLLPPLADVNLKQLRDAEIGVIVNIDKKHLYLKADYSTGVENLYELPNYIYTVLLGDTKYHLFQFLPTHEDALKKFFDGDYTLIKPHSKRAMCQYSGLTFNNNNSMAYFETSAVLLALFADNGLKKGISLFLEVEPDELPTELLPKFQDDSDIFIKNFIKSLRK